jgi:hypothetical protein
MNPSKQKTLVAALDEESTTNEAEITHEQHSF